MRNQTIRRAVAAASATAMAGAALVVGGAGAASAAEAVKPGTVSGSAGNKLEFKRTISSGEVTYGETVTITSEIVDSKGVTWWANTHSWIENNTEPCLQYVPGSAKWRAWPSESFETPSTKPGEFKPSENVIRAQFPAVVSDPLVLKADYVVLCDAGDAVATGGMSWKGTYGSSGSEYRSFGPTIKVNRATVSDFFFAAPVSPEVGKITELVVTTSAPEGSRVTFDVEGKTLSGTVTGGKATASWTPASAGSKQIVATFAGTPTHAGKTETRTVNVAAQVFDSTTTLTAPSDAQHGVKSQLSATVAPTAAAGGRVEFLEDGKVVGGGMVSSSGSVTIDWYPSKAGNVTIDARYLGNDAVRSSQAIGQNVTVAAADVAKESSTTTLDEVSMTQVGQSIALRAVVDPAYAGGTVSFFDGAELIGDIQVDASGVATLTGWKPSTSGERTVTAHYSGTPTVHPSQDSVQVVITSSTDAPEEPNPGGPSGGTGSLGSLTENLGGGDGGSSGSLSFLGS
ncbi:Ig-like domain repeat protein [Dietzia sp. NPDC055343]